PWDKEADAERRMRQQTTLFRFVLNAFVLVMGEARTERVEALRNSWPEVPPLCVDGVDFLKVSEDEAQTKGAQVAVVNRLDMMNVRSQLVDAWRQVAVFANALLGTFNVQYHLDSTTPMGRGLPFAFSGSRSRNQLIMNFEAPLVRMQERNAYRAALIAFQRSRRAVMAAQDLAAFPARGEIRQCRGLAG